MNDRFKFRCYNRKTKKMYEVDSLHLDSENEWVWVHYYNPIYDKDLKIQIEQPNAIIMQCTGLKDKNGKLIYEGDIVRTHHIAPMGTEVDMICVVEFDRGAFWINFKYGATYLVHDDTHHEVIGNIYENKDLLNENS